MPFYFLVYRNINMLFASQNSIAFISFVCSDLFHPIIVAMSKSNAKMGILPSLSWTYTYLILKCVLHCRSYENVIKLRVCLLFIHIFFSSVYSALFMLRKNHFYYIFCEKGLKPEEIVSSHIFISYIVNSLRQWWHRIQSLCWRNLRAHTILQPEKLYR